ncbi:VIT1/CCC1 transporter family protein [Rhodanobacter sp. B2A1Ga4]|uniref:VIT1/CCC1 transporter family protein n=1 Tax=Rhodanobacter sp. B2A1Ga4 TaxID=2778647 RepID=UPI001B37E044|nr:VIT1/CCC1 transporter family protein [Rhodanobacter sp. B2A1Ga4]MBQ4856231.1 VIT1/CCC1 transporter family protein [Rhodanobacter sp. B2A1Ga4]
MADHRTRHFRNNLRIERDNAALYGRLAELADDARLSQVYRRIAAGEHSNAQFWEARLREVGEAVPPPRIGPRVRALSWFAQRFGTEFVMPTVVRLAHADHQVTPVDRSGHRDHFPLSQAAGPHGLRHRAQSGNTLRAAVLGANDGLVSNVSLVMGMAGAATGDRAVLLAGLAGLVAGACSMALGEWLSVNSSREFYQAQITERAERLAVAPEDGLEHIAGFYREKGLEPAAAEHLAEHIAETPRAALDMLVREDLGVDPAELGGSAWGAAISSFCLFACGALFPVAPYFFLGGYSALLASACSTAAGLALIGIGTSLFTGRSMLFSIARQFGITAAAAAITYGVGHLLGVVLS